MQTSLPWLYVVAGLIVTLASIALSVEVFNRLKDPSYVPACNLNPILSCTSVADSNQAHAFGIPNYFLGIAGYGAITAIGLAVLAGGKFKRWFWQVLQAGMTFAFLFMTWLQFETIYRIGALCLFCMILWVFTWPLFWYTTLYNLNEKNIGMPARLSKAATFAQRYHAEILTSWYVLIIALILKRFWYYFGNL